MHSDSDHTAGHGVIEIFLQTLLSLLVSLPHFLLLLAYLLLSHRLANNLRAESQEFGQAPKELLLLIR